jgi:hypothetical protein
LVVLWASGVLFLVRRVWTTLLANDDEWQNVLAMASSCRHFRGMMFLLQAVSHACSVACCVLFAVLSVQLF